MKATAKFKALRASRRLKAAVEPDEQLFGKLSREFESAESLLRVFESLESRTIHSPSGSAVLPQGCA
jgi:hypothetical protein